MILELVLIKYKKLKKLFWSDSRVIIESYVGASAPLKRRIKVLLANMNFLERDFKNWILDLKDMKNT